MSVRLNSSGDVLLGTKSGGWGIGTGAFSVGFWVKRLATPTAQIWYAGVDDGSAVYACALSNDSDPRTNIAAATAGANTTASATSNSTWYWVVISRSGTTMRHRIFADSTSTTPAFDVTTTDSTNLTTAVVNFRIGSTVLGGWVDGEFTNAKLHVGVAWSDTEARNEALYYGNQTAGGTSYCWKLKDTGSDTDGLYEQDGSGPDLANTGCADGASDPTNLSEPSGGSIVPRLMLLGVG